MHDEKDAASSSELGIFIFYADFLYYNITMVPVFPEGTDRGIEAL